MNRSSTHHSFTMFALCQIIIVLHLHIGNIHILSINLVYETIEVEKMR